MCFVFALNLCSRSQAASSNAAGEGRLQALQELQAAHGRGRLEAELESMSGAVLRQVNKLVPSGYCCFVTTRIADPTSSSSLERPERRCDAADVSQM